MPTIPAILLNLEAAPETAANVHYKPLCTLGLGVSFLLEADTSTAAAENPSTRVALQCFGDHTAQRLQI